MLHRPRSPFATRWLLACALAAMLGAQGLAWVHAVLHPGAGHVHAAPAADADRLRSPNDLAQGHTHTASWVRGLVASHDDGSSLCQWFDALCLAGLPGDAPAWLLNDRPEAAPVLERPTPSGTSRGWQRPPARAPPLSA